MNDLCLCPITRSILYDHIGPESLLVFGSPLCIHALHQLVHVYIVEVLNLLRENFDFLVYYIPPT